MRHANRPFLLGPLAFAGAVAGHALAYTASHPEIHERTAALLVTGHGSFGRLVAGAAAAGLAALVVLALRARRREAIQFSWLVARLVPLQLAIFTSLELAERGFDAQRTFGDPAVLAGLVAQVLVALGAALLARGVERVARSIRSASFPAILRAPARLPRPVPAAPPSRFRWRRGDTRRRAPPLPLAA
ncbi:MAG TPA: hypothetical protein VGR49_03860 [Actinomycetota bacterium]|nr:hypothetical protein [Actinomycetota bacterium]